MTSLRLHRIGSLFLAVALLAGPAWAATWTSERIVTVDPLDSGTSLELRGTTLYASTSTRNYQLVVAKRDGDSWMNLPSVSISSTFSTKIDNYGRPHVLTPAYANNQTRLRLLRLADDWTWQMVTEVVTYPSHTPCGLAFDSQNRPHTAFVDHTAKVLKHMFWNGTAWITRTVASDPYFQYAYEAGTLLLDRNDVPHIVWCNDTDSYLSIWNGTTYVKWPLGVGRNPSPQFDSHNVLHICLGTKGYTLKYGTFDGSTWTSETILSSCDNAAMALDLLEQPHFVYRKLWYDFTRSAWYNDLLHVYRDKGAWTTEPLASWANTSSGYEDEAILVDPRNRLHVTYTDDSGNMWHAWKDLGRQTTVAPAFDAMAESSNGLNYVLTDGQIAIGTQHYPLASVWRRGLMDFPLAAVPPHLRVVAATLKLRICGYTSGPGSWPRLGAFGYAGNGSLEPADATIAGLTIGQSADITGTGPISIPLTRDYVNMLVSHSPCLGLQLYDPLTGNQADFYASEAAAYGLPAPALELEYTRATDLDGDGFVDVSDLLTLAAGWARIWSDPLFDPVCDINRDAAVDVEDLLALAADFGS